MSAHDEDAPWRRRKYREQPELSGTIGERPQVCRCVGTPGGYCYRRFCVEKADRWVGKPVGEHEVDVRRFENGRLRNVRTRG